MSWESSSSLQCQFDKDNNSSAKKTELSIQPHQLQEISKNIFQNIIENGTQQEFEKVIYHIAQAIQFQGNLTLLNNKTLHFRLVKLFYKLNKDIDSAVSQNYQLFILSLLAEIIRKNKQTRLPFSKKIVIALVNIDHDNLQNNQNGAQIILILAIIFANMATQSKFMVRLGVQKEVKEGLLLLLAKVDEFSTLRICLKALLDLHAKTQLTFTTQELQHYKVTLKVRDSFGDGAANKIKTMLCRPKLRKMELLTSMTLSDLISNK